MTPKCMQFLNEDQANRFYNDLLSNPVQYSVDLPMFDGERYVVYFYIWGTNE